MYSLLLVDDEINVLKSISNVIDWNAQGFEAPLLAESGEQACQILKNHTINLVITDMMMPRMNGLELVKYLTKTYPLTESIILSGYDDFEYAQSAMRWGVMEYITKPINNTEFESALRRAYLRIEKRILSKNNIAVLKKEFQKSEPVLRNLFLNNLSIQPYDSLLITQNFSSYHIKLSGAPYQVCCFDFNIKEDEQEYFSLLSAQLGIIFDAAYNNKKRYESFTVEKRVFYIIENIASIKDLLEDSMNNILSEFQNLTRVTLSASISKIHNSYDELYIARKECETAITEKNNIGEGIIIFYEDIPLHSNPTYTLHNVSIDNIALQIHSLNLEESILQTNQLFTQLHKEKAFYPHYYQLAISLLTELYNIASENSLKEHILEEILNLSDKKTANSLQAEIIEQIRLVITSTESECVSKNQKIITDINHYVNEHISEEITLKEIADYVFLSKNYLCSIFKKETGETFFNYLTKIRIEKAKTLLRETDFKVYYIAEKTGYKDYAYFSQVFKKQVGISAGEYREIYKLNT